MTASQWAARRSAGAGLVSIGTVLLLVAGLLVVLEGPVSAGGSQFTEYFYSFTFFHASDGTQTVISDSSIDNNNVARIDWGGTDHNSPIGMTVHVSCSDPFTDGWGSVNGPNSVTDSDWRIVSFSLFREIHSPKRQRDYCRGVLRRSIHTAGSSDVDGDQDGEQRRRWYC